MKAPHPLLSRLFRLAAAPAQRAQAWRSQGAALAALDAAPLDSAAASDARIEALLGEPQVGGVLAGPLARLAAAGQGTAADGAEPDRQRLSAGPGKDSPAVRHAVLPSIQPASSVLQPAVRHPAGLAPTGAAVQRRPTTETSAAGAEARWPSGVRLLPSARQAIPSLAATGDAALPPAGSAASRRPSDGTGAVPRAAATAAAGRVIDAAGAAERFQARAAKAGAAMAWQQAFDLQAAPGFEPTGITAAESVPAGSGVAWRGTDAADRVPGEPGLAPDAAASSQRAGSALARLAAKVSPRASLSPGGPTPAAASHSAARRETAGTSAGAPLSAPGSSGSPLQAARVGGFKGLAALGRLAGPAPGSSAATPDVATAAAFRPQPAALDPQAVIDHVEAALREQAARSGVSIEGLAP